MRVIWRPFSVVGKVALLGAVVAGVGGCSAMSELSGAPRAGYQNDGTYVLSAQEQTLGCRELRERQLSLQEQLQQLPSKAVQQMQELPKTVVDTWSRLVGSSDQGVPALAAYNEAKAESAAVDQSLYQKGCGTSMETASVPR